MVRFSPLESWCYFRESLLEPKDKIMLQCIGEVRCEQGFSIGTWYKGYNVLGELEWVYISGLMGSKSKNQIMNRRIFSQGVGEYQFLFRFLYGEPSAKSQWEKVWLNDRKFNFVIFVVWSALIVDRWLVVAWGENSTFGLADVPGFVERWDAGWAQQRKRSCDHKGGGL